MSERTQQEVHFPWRAQTLLLEVRPKVILRLFFSSVTDIDGLSDEFTLPAPSLEYSLLPNPAELPYSLYDLVISKDGYFTKRITGLSVFSGINSVQLISMIPGSGEISEDYPRGSVNYIIPENTNLQ